MLTSKNNDEELTVTTPTVDNSDDVEHIELCSFDGIERSSHIVVDLQRTAACYTPERLVRDEDYKILIPSARFCRPSCAEFTSEQTEFEDKNNYDEQFNDGKMGKLSMIIILNFDDRMDCLVILKMSLDIKNFIYGICNILQTIFYLEKKVPNNFSCYSKVFKKGAFQRRDRVIDVTAV